jgi:hypothetical protein
VESVLHYLIENAYVLDHTYFTSCPRGLNSAELSNHFEQIFQRRLHHIPPWIISSDDESAEDSLPDLVEGIEKLHTNPMEDSNMDTIEKEEIYSKSI